MIVFFQSSISEVFIHIISKFDIVLRKLYEIGLSFQFKNEKYIEGAILQMDSLVHALIPQHADNMIVK